MNMLHKQAMILSAGFGTRMKEYTKNKPKPLLPIAGYPLITYSLFLLYLFKVEKVVINLHYKGEQIKQFLKDFPYFEVKFSEEEEILGTAGGIAYAIYQNLLESYFILINSDIILFPDFNPYEDLSFNHHFFINHLMYIKQKNDKHKNERSFIIIENNHNEIKIISLKDELLKPIEMKTSEEYFYIGFSIFHESFFDYYKKKMEEVHVNHIPLIFKKELSELLYQKKLYGKLYKGIHLECGTKEEYEELIQKFTSPYEIIPKQLHHQWNYFIQGWLK